VAWQGDIVALAAKGGRGGEVIWTMIRGNERHPSPGTNGAVGWT
jgi:hypothetical protein